MTGSDTVMEHFEGRSHHCIQFILGHTAHVT